MTSIESPRILTGDTLRIESLTDHPGIPDKATYKSRRKSLQRDLLRIQRAYYRSGRRALLVFEGMDASGKGGAIRRLTEKLDPRGYQVLPIGPPLPSERGRHYLWRFWQHLPVPGLFTIFDRSYYGRVLIERVEDLISEAEWTRAYDEINDFERLLMDDGVRIVKCFMQITPEEQLRRFEERFANPDKRWKLTVTDIRNRELWPAYQTAINDMLSKTGTPRAPWHLVLANQKRHARIAVLESVVNQLGEGIEYPPEPINPDVVRESRERLGIDLTSGEE